MAPPAQAQQTSACLECPADDAWADFRQSFLAHYPYLDRGGSPAEVEAIFARADALAAGKTTLGELGTVIDLLSIAFRDGHIDSWVTPGKIRNNIPSNTDIWITGSDDLEYRIEEVRTGGRAQAAGLKPGMAVTGFDGVSLALAARELIAPLVPNPSPAQLEYAANAILAGLSGSPRRITIRDGEIERDVTLAAGPLAGDPPPGHFSIEKDGSVAIIRINNSLGDNDSIKAFDEAIASLTEMKGLVLDLRDTPGGGNTDVARGVLEHFIDRPVAYQRHERVNVERTLGPTRMFDEYVVPRGTRFEGPVAVLAGRWTASVGEALAMAMRAVGGARVFGGPLADLLGNSESFALSDGKLPVRYPAERLSDPEGIPREAFLPDQLVRPVEAAGEEDRALAEAIDWIERRTAP